MLNSRTFHLSAVKLVQTFLASIFFSDLPVVNENSSKQKDDTFQIDLLMTVFPLPTCKFFYEVTLLSNEYKYNCKRRIKADINFIKRNTKFN